MSEEHDDERYRKQKHVKDSKEKKRKREKESSIRHVLRLFNYAASGQTAKLEKLVGNRDIDVNSFNSEGHTALHQAARCGHTDAVASLLRYGADARAEDFGGNTPAHLAAAKKHIVTLAELLQAKEAPDLDAANGDGVTVRDLMQAAVEAKASEARGQSGRDALPGAHLLDSDNEIDPTEEWAEKLRDYAGYDDFDASAADWDSFEYSSFGGGAATAEDEDAYARRMWEAMRRRSAGGQGPSPATAETWARADEAQDKRRRAAEDAAERSRRILDEEQARDRAWRQAVQQGDLGARRAGYEAKWHVFAASADPIRFEAVPWLVEDTENARAIILYGTSNPAEERKRLRLELMRWHPDKFIARFGNRVVAHDAERVLERVKRVSQMLNSLGSSAA